MRETHRAKRAAVKQIRHSRVVEGYKGRRSLWRLNKFLLPLRFPRAAGANYSRATRRELSSRFALGERPRAVGSWGTSEEDDNRLIRRRFSPSSDSTPFHGLCRNGIESLARGALCLIHGKYTTTEYLFNGVDLLASLHANRYI